MNKNGIRFVLSSLFAVLLCLGNSESCSAQLFQLDDSAAQQEDVGKRGGYITEFLSQRSGEPGIFGFIGWMLSKDMWKDIASYIEKKFQQKMNALLQEFEERNAVEGDLGLHTLDVFSQPLVFV